MALNNLIGFWEENLKNNIKKISAYIGDILLNILIVLLYAARSGIDPFTMFLMIVLSIKPFLFQGVNLIFKGDNINLEQANLQLQQKIAHVREIAEYQVQLAAHEGKVIDSVKANKDWNDSNKMLEEE